MARIGVVGAGRVGAVLSAALRAAGHEIVAAAGDSAASLHRIETLLPGVPSAKPTDVARAADLLLLTVPDDMLENVVTTLVGAGAIREGQVVCHTSGPPRPRRARLRHRHRRAPGRDAPRDDLHRHRARPRASRRLRLRHDRRRRRARAGRGLVADLGGIADVGAREQAHALPRRSGARRQPPRHPGQPGDGAAGRLGRRGPRRHAAARCSPLPSTTRSPRATRR